MCGSKFKGIAIVQLVLLIIALILSICALAGGTTDQFDTMEALYWAKAEHSDVYQNFWGSCIKVDPMKTCMEWTSANKDQEDIKDPLYAMASLGTLTVIVHLVLTALKLCCEKCAKSLDVIGLLVGVLAVVWTIACFSLAAGSDNWKADGFEWGPGFGASVATAVFKLIAVLLGAISLCTN